MTALKGMDEVRAAYGLLNVKQVLRESWVK